MQRMHASDVSQPGADTQPQGWLNPVVVDLAWSEAGGEVDGPTREVLETLEIAKLGNRLLGLEAVWEEPQRHGACERARAHARCAKACVQRSPVTRLVLGAPGDEAQLLAFMLLDALEGTFLLDMAESIGQRWTWLEPRSARTRDESGITERVIEYCIETLGLRRAQACPTPYDAIAALRVGNGTPATALESPQRDGALTPRSRILVRAPPAPSQCTEQECARWERERGAVALDLVNGTERGPAAWIDQLSRPPRAMSEVSWSPFERHWPDALYSAAYATEDPRPAPIGGWSSCGLTLGRGRLGSAILGPTAAGRRMVTPASACIVNAGR